MLSYAGEQFGGKPVNEILQICLETIKGTKWPAAQRPVWLHTDKHFYKTYVFNLYSDNVYKDNVYVNIQM